MITNKDGSAQVGAKSMMKQNVNVTEEKCLKDTNCHVEEK